MTDVTPRPQKPGFNEFVGLVEGEVGEGHATVVMIVDERHLNPAGSLHGGAIATLVDVAMGWAVASLFTGDERPITVEMKINFLEAGERGTLVATARVSRRGRRFTVVHAEVTQEATQETLAEAMGTFTSG